MPRPDSFVIGHDPSVTLRSITNGCNELSLPH